MKKAATHFADKILCDNSTGFDEMDNLIYHRSRHNDRHHCSLVVTCWERANLLALLCVIFTCVFVTFPCGVLG